jgi:hypothetical protein
MARPPLPPGQGIRGGTITFRLSTELRDRIELTVASDPDLTQTALIRVALEEYFDRYYGGSLFGAA